MILQECCDLILNFLKAFWHNRNNGLRDYLFGNFIE